MTEVDTTQSGAAPPRRGGVQLSLAAKLLGVGLLGVALVAATGLAGWAGGRSVAAQADRIKHGNQLLRAGMLGDMMHDAIYGDVYTSFKTGAKGHDEVAARLADHEATMRSSLLDNRDLAAEPALADDLATVRPELEAYLDQATRLVDQEAKDPAGAERALPAFLDAYERLEGGLGDLNDHIEQLAGDAAKAADATAASVARIQLVLALVSIALLVGAVAWILSQLRRRLAGLSAGLRAVAGKDLTVHLPVQGDELGAMAGLLNDATGGLRQALEAIAASSDRLSSSSHELASVANQLESNTSETSAQAGVVSAAAEEVSRNIETVAAGAEEMSASIKEIARSASEAAKVATSAVSLAQESGTTVAKLGDSSSEIAGVIKVITSIAEQTNLLALNATIEAARAGEAGKGFAVVAGEVKELAQETAKATEDISRRIDAIQTDTQAAITAIDQIGSVIGEINDTQTTIAGAVEQQSATTSEIGRNVTEAAGGSTEIARNITGVASAANATTTSASDTQRVVDDLAGMADEIRELVGQFRY